MLQLAPLSEHWTQLVLLGRFLEAALRMLHDLPNTQANMLQKQCHTSCRPSPCVNASEGIPSIVASAGNIWLTDLGVSGHIGGWLHTQGCCLTGCCTSSRSCRRLRARSIGEEGSQDLHPLVTGCQGPNTTILAEVLQTRSTLGTLWMSGRDTRPRCWLTQSSCAAKWLSSWASCAFCLACAQTTADFVMSSS